MEITRLMAEAGPELACNMAEAGIQSAQGLFEHIDGQGVATKMATCTANQWKDLEFKTGEVQGSNSLYV